MPETIVIAINNTASEILLDIGKTIDASSSVNLTQLYPKRVITKSENLKTFVSAGDITINDGSQDLSIPDGLLHIKFETEYEDAEGPRPTWTISTAPPSDPYNGQGWYDQNSNILYTYDSTAQLWLSVERDWLLFQRQGVVQADYFKIGTVANADAGYLLSRDARLMAWVARATGGNGTRTYQVIQNNTIVAQRQCTGGVVLDNNVGVNLDSSSVIKVKGKFETTDEANWYDIDWEYRKSLTINSSQVSGSSVHEDFPVYVSITSTDFTKAQSGGQDFVFVDSTSNTKLDHEIESFDSGTGELIAWVRIPELDPGEDKDLYIYYGNGSVADQQNITGVWASKYAAVWHFNEDGGPYLDSTQNDNDGSATNAPVRNSTGTIGPYYQSFNGTDDVITVSNSTSMNITEDTITLQAWFRNPAGGNADDSPLITRGPSTNNERYMLGVDGGVNPENINKRVTTDTGHYRYDNSSWDRGSWNFVHLVYNGELATNPRFLTYKNGSLATSNNASGSILSDTGDILIGKRFDSARYLAGDLDELRVLNRPLSADWISTEWANQNSPGTFYSLGTEEDRDNIVLYCLDPMVELELAWRR